MNVSKKIVAIHQPDFLPSLNFFKKMKIADKFVYLDDVEISKGGWTNRDKIKTKNGSEWINVNLRKYKLNELIRNIKISYTKNWQLRSLNLIIENYKNSKYFGEIYPFVEKIFDFSPEYLIDFNTRSLNILRDILEINNEIIYSSKLGINKKKNELLVEIIKKIHANTYLSGIGAKDYIDEEIFKKNQIKVIFNEFDHPIYKQQFTGFIKDLSILDYLFNCGIKSVNNFLEKKTI